MSLGSNVLGSGYHDHDYNLPLPHGDPWLQAGSAIEAPQSSFLACFPDVDISSDEVFAGDILWFYCLVILRTIPFRRW